MITSAAIARKSGLKCIVIIVNKVFMDNFVVAYWMKFNNEEGRDYQIAAR
ncbi:MAG: hypothetical protein K0R59_2284 [Sphingobacterium sp.]|jgi:hypothetical protein|nr:hypothetical protein [Sphingobacterium sp.]